MVTKSQKMTNFFEFNDGKKERKKQGKKQRKKEKEAEKIKRR